MYDFFSLEFLQYKNNGVVNLLDPTSEKTFAATLEACLVFQTKMWATIISQWQWLYDEYSLFALIYQYIYGHNLSFYYFVMTFSHSLYFMLPQKKRKVKKIIKIDTFELTRVSIYGFPLLQLWSPLLYY